MASKSIINELKLIIAHNESMSQRCYELLKQLEGVSTPSTKKTVDAKTRANLIAKRRKTMYK